MLGVKVESKLDTVVGPESEIKGDVSVRGSMRLDGKIEGTVSVLESLYIGRGAHVKGNVHCKDGVFGGKIEGNVTAQGMIELQAGATLIGDIRCRNLVLDKDALLNGRVMMSEEKSD